MIFWTIKQLLSLKKAFTGRANPRELAWGLALGIAIGLIPKGNLVSVSLIGLLVCLRVNHGMAALAAVATSFIAFRFDPWTHQLGTEILQTPRTHALLTKIWDKPLVPWTELNNTVVLGSTVIGLTSILPTFMITLPLFRWLAPKSSSERELEPPPAVALALETPAPVASSKPNAGIAKQELGKNPQSVLDKTSGSQTAHRPDLHVVGLPSAAAKPDTTELPTSSSPTISRKPANSNPNANPPTETQSPLEARPQIETQIEIIRMKPKDDSDFEADGDDINKTGPMNEALGYLLRRLRDSRQGKAA